MKNKILIIDDDKDFTAMLKTFLQLKEFDVVVANSQMEINVNWSEIDLVLLDINMPDANGFEICKRIREFFFLPILFLSARSSEEDKIKGLMLGGDDYITKPFSLEELYARIHTNISRIKRAERCKTDYEFKNEKFFISGSEILLTKTEYDILDLLARHPKQIFSKEHIYECLWGYEVDSDEQVVSEHIRNIRNKIKAYSDKELIKTYWGRGYSWIG